jgi:predicted lipoprotein
VAQLAALTWAADAHKALMDLTLYSLALLLQAADAVMALARMRVSLVDRVAVVLVLMQTVAAQVARVQLEKVITAAVRLH